jgi:hypothetical protein
MRTRQAPSFTYSVVACLTLVSQAPLGSDVPADSSTTAQRAASDGAKRGDSSAPVCIASWVIDAAGTRQLPDHCLLDARETAAALAGVVPRSDGCEPPWFVDSRGIQRIRSECLGPASGQVAAGAPDRVAAASDSTAITAASATGACDPPWWLDAHGIQRLKIKCLGPAPGQAEVSAPERVATASDSTADRSTASATDDCDPPWWLDAHGIQRLKVKCLGPAPGQAEVSAPDRLPAASHSLPATSPALPAEHCDPPWYFDANGIQRLRPQCL